MVLEQGLADALGLHVGNTVHLGNHSFKVGGIAVTTQQSFYPASTPGLVWVTRSDAQQLAGATQPLGYVLDIKLAAGVPWEQIRTDDHRVIALDRKVLLFGSSLLSLLALASIAVLVGGRMAEQTRRVGFLKAVGATPSLVAMVLLCENLVLALGASILGIVVADLLTPALASPGQGLLGRFRYPCCSDCAWSPARPAEPS